MLSMVNPRRGWLIAILFLATEAHAAPPEKSDLTIAVGGQGLF